MRDIRGPSISWQVPPASSQILGETRASMRQGAGAEAHRPGKLLSLPHSSAPRQAPKNPTAAVSREPGLPPQGQ